MNTHVPKAQPQRGDVASFGQTLRVVQDALQALGHSGHEKECQESSKEQTNQSTDGKQPALLIT